MEYKRSEDGTRYGRYQDTRDIHLGIREDVPPRDNDGILASRIAMANDLFIGVKKRHLNSSALIVYEANIPPEKICVVPSLVRKQDSRQV